MGDPLSVCRRVGVQTVFVENVQGTAGLLAENSVVLDLVLELVQCS
jgi:hypothetical protein